MAVVGRTVRFDKASDLREAEAIAVAYFADRQWANVELVESGRNALGHWSIELTAEPPSRKDQNELALAQVNRLNALVSESRQILSTETLRCTVCGQEWERARVRGRKPTVCPQCAVSAPKPVSKPFGTEVLKCSACDTEWQRALVRGRKPSLCPECRGKDEE